MSEPFYQKDFFAEIHAGGRLQERLGQAHKIFSRQCPGLDRISIALFDTATGKVQTFLASPAAGNPLSNYQIPLAEAESLAAAAIPGLARIINNLQCLAQGQHEHTRKVWALGMRSSYTLPIYEQGRLCGFVFLNSQEKDFFQGKVLLPIPLFAHFLVQMVLNHQNRLRTLVAALRITSRMMHYKDPETGNHLERMARFSRLIAQELVSQGQVDFDDEEIDHLYRFAPLHDIGKVGIPDDILQKPGQLDTQEWSVMKTHSGIGRAIVDQLINEFGFSNLPDIEILRHITELHHEKIDGSGYPHGLSGGQVPIAARIIGVSDIFDALTSARPYKDAWSNQAALAELDALVQKNRLDGDCVAALQNRLTDVRMVQQCFSDT